MKKFFTTVLTVLSAMIFITACATNVLQNDEDKNAANSLDNIQDKNNPTEIVTDDCKNIVFECSPLQNSPNNYKETPFYFSDCEDSEQTVTVSISANCDLNSFKIIELEFDDNNGTVSYRSVNTLFTLDSLPANTDFVINTVFIGALPNRAISFLDADNVERLYALTTSGADGSVFLYEITDNPS